MTSPILSRASALGISQGPEPRRLLDSAALGIFEEPLLPAYSLRPPRGTGIESVEVIVRGAGLPLPARPNTCSGGATLACAWLEPRAWLLLGPELAPVNAPIATEVGERFAAFRLGGPQAAALLAAGTALRLAPGGCSRTLFAEEVVVLVQQFESDCRLLIDVSLGPWLADWLLDAAQRL